MSTLFCENSESDVSIAPSSERVLLAESAAQKAAPVQPSQPQSFKLVPHKAVYEIKLLKKPNYPTVSDVTGESTIEIFRTEETKETEETEKAKKTKEGWSYKQTLKVQIHYYDGSTSVVEKNVASWESLDEASFCIQSSRDGAQESVLQCSAEAIEEGGWRVYFKIPDMDGFITDYPLVFPIGHLEKILATIEADKTVLSDQIVFAPSHEMQDPVRINTVITPVKGKQVELKNNLLPSSKLWRVCEAIYDFKSSNASPDYEESNLELFSTGVINSMETTWGEGITVVLRLKELTIYK